MFLRGRLAALLRRLWSTSLSQDLLLLVVLTSVCYFILLCSSPSPFLQQLRALYTRTSQPQLPYQSNDSGRLRWGSSRLAEAAQDWQQEQDCLPSHCCSRSHCWLSPLPGLFAFPGCRRARERRAAQIRTKLEQQPQARLCPVCQEETGYWYKCACWKCKRYSYRIGCCTCRHHRWSWQYNHYGVRIQLVCHATIHC